MRHTISVLIDNNSGVLTRITGLFARRGYNIIGLSVGPTEKYFLSRLIVIVNDEEEIVEQLIKQLYKFVNVRKIEDITNVANVNRELMLLKVKVTEQTRTEILDIAKIFSAKIVDFCEDSLTIEVTGEYAKIEVIENLLKKFTVLELAKTGAIALLRNSNVSSQYLHS